LLTGRASRLGWLLSLPTAGDRRPACLRGFGRLADGLRFGM